MNMLALVVVEVGLCIGISLGLILLIQPLLRGVLIETCGTEKRADFWARFTQIMLVITPLLLVVYYVPTDSGATINVAEEIKNTLFRSLLGTFIGWVLIGRGMLKYINYSASKTTVSHIAGGER